MKQFAWFALAIKGIGVLLIGMSLSSLLRPLQWIALLFEPSQPFGTFSQNIGYFIASLGPFAQLVFGLYLLLGGRRIIARCLKMVDGHCIVCGYDVRGLEVEVCPECGASCGDMAGKASDVSAD